MAEKGLTIRPAEENDVLNIQALATHALGDQPVLRSVPFWKWKHKANPFGESPVLVMQNADDLVGLRALMRWNLVKDKNIFTAHRAVDTATHPDYHGKGIFTQLTFSLLEQLNAGDPTVIFNTPNRKSRPGYLKMGWAQSGKTRLKICLSPSGLVKNHLGSKTKSGYVQEKVILPESLEELLAAHQNLFSNQVTTACSTDYLRWRYMEIPGVSYSSHFRESENGCCWIIWRIKKNFGLVELRLLEIFFSGSPSNVREAIREVISRTRPDVVTVLTDGCGIIDECLPTGFIPASALGLNITVRKVNDAGLFNDLMNTDNRYLSAGTLELF